MQRMEGDLMMDKDDVFSSIFSLLLSARSSSGDEDDLRGPGARRGKDILRR